MKAILLALSLLSIIGITGCGDDKQYFIPKIVYSPSDAIQTHGRSAYKIARDGITFTTGEIITSKGKSHVILPKGYRYINQSSKYILAANESRDVIILSKRTRNMVRKIRLSNPLVSGVLYGKKIMYVLEDNIFGMYDLANGKNLVELKLGDAYAIDSRVTNPILLHHGNQMAIPALDGKILLLNPKNPHGAQSISIGTENIFNNVIYLNKIGDRRIIAATPRKLISAAKGSNHKFEAQIADVDISGSFVYVATQDGRVIKFSKTLKKLAEKRFTFAEFLSIGVIGNRVYAVDKQGAIIVLDKSLQKSSIYKIDKVEDYTFISGSKLYVDKKVISLPKLPL